MSKRRLNLFTSTDTNYLPHAKALLASFRHFHPDGTCVVYGVDLPNSSREELVRFGAVLVTADRVPKTDTRIQAACWRFCALMGAFPQREEEVVVAYDADTIVRGRLDSIASTLETADVAVLLRRGRDPNRRIYAGVLGVRPTNGSRLFFQAYEQLLSEDVPTWYADQRCLFRAYAELQGSSKIKFANLLGVEMNRRLDDSALAWCPSRTKRCLSKFRSVSSAWQEVFADYIRP